MRFGPLVATLTLASACGSDTAIEASLPPDLPRDSVVGLRILIVPETSLALSQLRREGPITCDAFSALAERRERTVLSELVRSVSFPLEGGEVSFELTEPLDTNQRLFVHVVALARGAKLVGDAQQESMGSATVSEVSPAAVAEGCNCVDVGAPALDGRCADASAGPVPIALGPLVRPLEGVKLSVLGPPRATVVRGTRSLVSPAIHVDVAACTASRDSVACLSCSGECRRPDLPLVARIDGDTRARLPTPVLLTSAKGDVVVPIEAGDCEAFDLTVAVVGHPEVSSRIQVTCVDDLPAPRAPVAVVEGLADVRLVSAGARAVALSATDEGRGSRLTVLAASRGAPEVTSVLELGSERPAALARAGTDGGVVVATMDAVGALHLRRYVPGAGGSLALAAETSGACAASGCGLTRLACTRELICAGDRGDAVSIDVADVDGDGVDEITVVRAGAGLTVYDRDLGRCRRLNTAPPVATAHVLARFEGELRSRTLIASGGSSIYVRAPDELAESGLPCVPGGPPCEAGRVCHVPCPAGAPCADAAATVATGTCIAPCGAEGEACGDGGRCAVVTGGALACLEPGPSCEQAMSPLGLVEASGRVFARTTPRVSGDREDVVSLVPRGAPRLFSSAAEPLSMANRAARTPILFARPQPEAPKDARALAVGDVNADGLDDVAVAYAGQVRTWLGGDGVPGEASAIEVPGCVPGALALADLEGTGRAGVLVECSGTVLWIPR